LILQLIRDLSDLSFRTTKGRREKGRSLKDGIVDVGTLTFLEMPHPAAITKEMILDDQKSLTEPLKDPITRKPITDKYNPSTFAYDVSDIADSMVEGPRRTWRSRTGGPQDNGPGQQDNGHGGAGALVVWA
jgi:hypothetical protein